MLHRSRLLTSRFRSSVLDKLNIFYLSPIQQDYYDVSADLPKGSGAAAYIQAKFNATTSHVTEAGTSHPDQLYISFASAAFIDDQPPMTPQVSMFRLLPLFDIVTFE